MLKNTSQCISLLCVNVTQEQGSVLVFCATKDKCENTAAMLSKTLPLLDSGGSEGISGAVETAGGNEQLRQARLLLCRKLEQQVGALLIDSS